MCLEEISRWTLVGGTALSIHYQHRLSEDLDFFIRNSTLDQDRKRIERMMQKLEELGFEVIRLYEDDRQIDFEISGVKVTFFASSLKMLQQKGVHFGNIAVASIETIKAMKMDAILNHRTLRRDFFDIATILNQEKLTIFDLLESYRKHYEKKLSSSLILERLIQRGFETGDPGLVSMQPKADINPDAFRKKLSEQIKTQAQKDTKSIDTIINNPSAITKYLDRKFGLGRMNLPLKLASIGEDCLVMKALKIGDFNIAYKDISGKTLLDFYLDNDAMFIKVLAYAKEIPQEWLKSRTFKNHDKDRFISIENSIISCVANEQNSPEKIERIAGKHGVDTEEILKRIEAKKEVLRKALF